MSKIKRINTKKKLRRIPKRNMKQTKKRGTRKLIKRKSLKRLRRNKKKIYGGYYNKNINTIEDFNKNLNDVKYLLSISENDSNESIMREMGLLLPNDNEIVRHNLKLEEIMINVPETRDKLRSDISSYYDKSENK